MQTLRIRLWQDSLSCLLCQHVSCKVLTRLTSKHKSLVNKRLARKSFLHWHICWMLEGIWDSLIGNICMCLWLAMMEACLLELNTLTRKVLAAERRAATFGLQDEMPGRWVSADSMSHEWVTLSRLPSSLPLSGFARLAAILSSSICGSVHESQLHGKVLTFLTLVRSAFLASKTEVWIPHVHHLTTIYIKSSLCLYPKSLWQHQSWRNSSPGAMCVM